MGEIPGDGLVRWVVWEELSMPPATLFPDCFVRAYTLAKYREWGGEQEAYRARKCMLEGVRVWEGPSRAAR